MKKITSKLANYEYENSILTVTPISNLTLDEVDMKSMLHEAVEFTEGEKYYVLIDTINDIDITADARNYYATSHLNKNRYADAFVISSLATKIVFNFYLKINKPAIPTKMFTDKNAALEWLLELKNNNSKMIDKCLSF